MPRMLLRAKSGCQQCKRRRKKCDEARPICGACRRWTFQCLWPENDSSSANRVRERVGPKRYAMINIERPIAPHGFAGFRDQTQMSLLRSFASIYRDFICPLAGPEYADLSPFITVALTQSWSRDALNAFTSYMIFARSADKRLEQPALEIYQSAVSSLQVKVKHSLQKPDVVSMLMAATFLGLLEVSETTVLSFFVVVATKPFQGLGTGSAYHAIAQFSLVARLGQSCFRDSIWNGFLLPLKRIVLEDVVYNLACMSIFCPVPNSTFNALDWASYGESFSIADSGVSGYELSPHFGGNYEFYQLILEVTHVSRQPLSESLRNSYADSWLSRLDFLDDRLWAYYESSPKRVAAMYVAKYQLHAIALRIFSLKVKQHDLLPCASVVRLLVNEAEQIFAQNVLQENHNPSLTWPLIVLLCSCADLITFQHFIGHIESIKTNFGRGHFHNLDAVQKKIRRSLGTERGASSIKTPDNLGLLLLKGGLLSARE